MIKKCLPGSPFFSHDQHVNQITHFLWIPLCLNHSSHWLPSGLLHVPSKPVCTTQSPPPIPPRALPLHLLLHFSFFLPLSLSHPLIDPFSFQGFPFCPSPPNSSTDPRLLHSRQTQHFFCAPPPQRSLSHPPLQFSFSHNFTFHTLRHSYGCTYATQLHSMHMPSIHI